MDKWQGKFAIVTGASSGIGAEITKKFAENGINVIALARRPEVIEENINKAWKLKLGNNNGKIHAHKCDISNLESITETFKWIEQKFGTINILVNNAAMFLRKDVLDQSDETTKGINDVINTNITGLVHCTRKSIALMKKNSNPSIVINISSTLAHKIPFAGASFSIYPPTKYAVRAFNEIVRQELMIEKNQNIRTSCISPGLVNTPMAGKELIDTNPHVEPEDIVDACLYILSTPTRVNIMDMIVQHPFGV